MRSLLMLMLLAGCGSGLQSTGFDVDVETSDDAGEDTRTATDPSNDSGNDTGTDVPVTPDAGAPGDTAMMPAEDSDGDGLPDAWENAAGLDSTNPDSDGDGVPDGEEDLDADGLTNAMELAISAWTIASDVTPDPRRRDLLVELDEMAGKTLSSAVLANAAAAYGALPEPVGLLVFRDETNIGVAGFDGSFEQRHAFLEQHGPTFGSSPSPLPVAQMIHVAVASRRQDDQFRGGEVVTDGEGDVDKTGVLIYYDALAALHPQCGIDGDPPDITLDEALASTLAHEIGHVLQLGHDTDVSGGVNYFNIMSVPTTCNEAQQRFHGEGNSDANLGATDGNGSRFSAEAAALMRFDQRLSVDTAELVNDGVGQPM